ncbi:hypothetical protein Bxe_A4458 [Paraburkholderia xenovorans LB400]|uniref:Uncharacterized protein n=1 Tax=Paraburkholderia xenovorans (strain LB400) TaxID=266265 RepID=Q147E6_PARXL|nr:hypothetical protein Bxe_A4458 [Paraburkholderia xenovorans LB400]
MLYVRRQRRIPKIRYFLDHCSCKRFRQNEIALEAMHVSFDLFRKYESATGREEGASDKARARSKERCPPGRRRYPLSSRRLS